MDKHTPPQEALDSLDEIDRSLHQMLMLAELSASDGEAFYLTRWTRMGMFCRLQLSITCFVPRDVPSQRATTRSA